MTSKLKAFQKKFDIQNLIIFETKHWVWSLRPHQATLGASILSLKSEKDKLSDLHEEEFKDLYNIIPVIENAIQSSFKYDVLNYLLLMMNDKQVHYHIIPRYENSRDYFNLEWNDTNWPDLPVMNGTPIEKDLADQLIKLLINKIKDGKDELN